MFMLLPNGHFLALPPEFWPHWYFWDCACAARMSMVIFSSRVASRSRRLRGSGAQRRGRWWRERSKAATRSSNMLSPVADMAPHTLWSAMGQNRPPALQKKGRRKLAPRRDATRSHATLTAIRCPHSGLEA
jgi:hypothetical protein